MLSRHHVEVPVPQIPAGVGVARHRLHLHVDCEQVVASVGPVLEDLVEEMACGEALPVDPPVVVGEAGHHRVDFVGGDQRLQLVDADQSPQFAHSACSLPSVSVQEGRPR